MRPLLEMHPILAMSVANSMDPAYRVSLLKHGSLIAKYFQDLLLDAIWELEANLPPPMPARCSDCSDGRPEYRCLYCFSTEWMCGACMVACHMQNLLHRIEVRLPWRIRFFNVLIVVDVDSDRTQEGSQGCVSQGSGHAHPIGPHSSRRLPHADTGRALPHSGCPRHAQSGDRLLRMQASPLLHYSIARRPPGAFAGGGAQKCGRM